MLQSADAGDEFTCRCELRNDGTTTQKGFIPRMIRLSEAARGQVCGDLDAWRDARDAAILRESHDEAVKRCSAIAIKQVEDDLDFALHGF